MLTFEKPNYVRFAEVVFPSDIASKFISTYENHFNNLCHSYPELKFSSIEDHFSIVLTVALKACKDSNFTYSPLHHIVFRCFTFGDDAAYWRQAILIGEPLLEKAANEFNNQLRNN